MCDCCGVREAEFVVVVRGEALERGFEDIRGDVVEGVHVRVGVVSENPVGNRGRCGDVVCPSPRECYRLVENIVVRVRLTEFTVKDAVEERLRCLVSRGIFVMIGLVHTRIDEDAHS